MFLYLHFFEMDWSECHAFFFFKNVLIFFKAVQITHPVLARNRVVWLDNQKFCLSIVSVKCPFWFYIHSVWQADYYIITVQQDSWLKKQQFSHECGKIPCNVRFVWEVFGKNASADIPDKTDGEHLSARLNMEMSALLILFTNIFKVILAFNDRISTYTWGTNTAVHHIWNNVNKIILTETTLESYCK